MYSLFKNFLFKLDPEETHERTISALKFAGKSQMTNIFRLLYCRNDPELASEHWGIPFSNPVGLAAGFDKNAEVYNALASLGFGFVEVGTITPFAQEGNEKPRLFRLCDDEAVINRMGFNNAGAKEASERLANYARTKIPIGVNIGKNKLTPNDEAAHDYKQCLDVLYPYGDYFVINVSSPNTPDLRDLQETEELRQLILNIQQKREAMERNGVKRKPVLLKVAPDMSDEQMRDVVQIAVTEGLSGIIATNTTLSREGLIDQNNAKQAGGLSGKPLTDRSTTWIKDIYTEVGHKVPIIGVGGIFNGEDAYAKIRAGASLIQVYTSMIYEGPKIVKAINQRLLHLMKRDGFTNISDVVGIDC